MNKTQSIFTKIICDSCNEVLREGTEKSSTEFKTCLRCILKQSKGVPERFKSTETVFDFIKSNGINYWEIQLLDYFKKPLFRLQFTPTQLREIADILDEEEVEAEEKLPGEIK